MKISDLILTLIVEIQEEIQEEANRIADASRTDTPEGKSSPNLNLERLIQQAQADAEIAGYCTTDKSRKGRRAALVRAGACTLLALFEMDREKGDCTGIVKAKQEGDRLVVVDGLYRAAIGEDEGGSYG